MSLIKLHKLQRHTGQRQAHQVGLQSTHRPGMHATTLHNAAEAGRDAP